MVGITSYGAYIPLHRVGPETDGWKFPIEKAVAHYDEDSLTMSVAAAIDCLGDIDRSTVDGLYFASTTSPYKEKLAATLAAIAADLRNDILTADCTNSLRAGTTALKMALDTIKAGSAKQLLVTAADCRIGSPRGLFDQNLGDGAAAFLIGDKNVIATIEASHSISNEMLDVWRLDSSKFIHAWEDRWAGDEGYAKVLTQAVKGLFEKCGITPKDISKAVFYGQDRRKHGQIARILKLEPEQIQDPLFGKLGNTGAAFSLMLLVAALEEAKPGDKILLASYGNGADAFLLQVTDEITKIKGKRGIKFNLETKIPVKSYEFYLSTRHLSPGEEEANYVSVPNWPSASCILRERDAIYRLYGSKCKSCGTVQYPPQRICTNCQAKDNMEPVRLSDKKGKVFTFALDNLANVPFVDLPMVDVLVDFEVGGRADMMMTDMKPRDVKIDIELEMTFRKLRTSGNIHNYFWKCTPLREGYQVKEAK